MAAQVIQDAVDAASNNDVVLVADGVYSNGARLWPVTNNLFNRLVITNSITVRSQNGPTNAIILGRGPLGSNAVRCVFMSKGTLEGFTLTNGFTRTTGHSTYDQGGGGAYASGGTLRGCVLSGNGANASGGGTYSGTLTNCTLTANVAGSGGGAYGSTLRACLLTGNGAANSGGGACSATLTNCTVTANTANYGGGTYSSTLRNSLIASNIATQTGGGVYSGGASNCALIANSAWWAGGSYNGTLNNCVLIENQAGSDGGGAYYGQLNNCTLVGNSAMNVAGGTRASSLNNCIIYFNIAPIFPNHYGATLNYCCTTPAPGDGMGNITANPTLASLSHLSVSSPCIAAGSAGFAGGADIDGEIWANPPSIGCDEVRAGAITGELTVAISATYDVVSPNTPVEFIARIAGRLAHSVWQFGDGATASNCPYVSHAFSATGLYNVVLSAINESFPGGVNATASVFVVEQPIHYVNGANATPSRPYTNWAAAATRLQDALDAVSVAGARVIVTNGVYATGGRVVFGAMTNRVAVEKAVTLASVNGPTFTTIKGNAPPGDNAVRCAYVGPHASLHGFTLTGGSTLASGDLTRETAGGGVWCDALGLVSNCVMTANQAAQYGGASFYGRLQNCILTGNSAYSGGGSYLGTLNTCALAGNTAFAYGGGTSRGTLNNCTLTGNSASYGGGMNFGTLNNCIAYYNTAIYGSNHYNSTLNHSCATPAPDGNANIDANPALVSSFHLSVDSPCLGAGDPAYALGADIDGDPWANPPAIGCDELSAGAATGGLSVAISASCTNVIPGLPVDFTAQISGRATRSLWRFEDGTALTNRPVVSHAFAATGRYDVVLTAMNGNHPDGVSATAQVLVVEQPVHYVNLSNAAPSAPFSTWATAATNIQNAIDAASVAGARILVTNGVYKTGGRVIDGAMTNRVAVDKPIIVTSVNGPAATLIQGAGPFGDSAVRCVYLGANAVLSGFTLTNGNTRNASDRIRESYGGGIFCEISAVVSNCILVRNTAYGGGGSFYGTLYDCAFIRNTATNGGAANAGTFYRCVFSNNAAVDGGAAYRAVLTDCLIASNSASYRGGGTEEGQLIRCQLVGNAAQWGGGALAGILSNCTLNGNSATTEGGGANLATLYYCTLTGNRAFSGGGAYGGLLNNCLLAGNSATNGGGAYVSGTTLNNCTLSGNTARFGGGAYIVWGDVNNCIVYDNVALSNGANYYGGAGAYLRYSCTAPDPGGEGNIAVAPGFVDAASGNYRLRADSPCVDAGINQSGMFDATDLDGRGRILNGTVDMGAYELAFEASIRAMLQGPYRTNLHGMAAGTTTHLPLTSPYVTDRRTVAQCPSNALDWILLELQDTNGHAVVSQSAFVDGNGQLLPASGETGLHVEAPPGAALYLVVKHRNHLAAKSAAPVAFTNTVLNYDFTTGPDRYFGGTNGGVMLEPGVWGLIAGDADGDGAVLDVDRLIWTSQQGRTGYCRGDFDLDGIVSHVDLALWSSNTARATSVESGATILSPALSLTPPRQTVSAAAAAAIRAAGSTGAVNWAFARNLSSGTLTSTMSAAAVYTAGAASNCVDIVEAWDTNGALGRAYFNVIGPEEAARAGKAIVIAGRKSAADPLWPTTDYLAGLGYNALLYRGFARDNVQYLSPVTGRDIDGNGLPDDIDLLSTSANAATAFTNWAFVPAPLFVYLVDHGGDSSGNGYFRLNETDTLTAAQLGAWLDALQNRYTNDVTVLIDCCQAGSFLDELAYTGTARRIVIAACATNQSTYFVAGGLVSFSEAFFAGILMGFDLQGAFALARDAMASYQNAWLDTDKNGSYAPSVDEPLAAGVAIGASFIAGKDMPVIGHVLGNQLLRGETTVTLWAYDIASSYPLDRVWCLIVPPGYAPDPADPVGDLPELDLEYNAGSGRYEAQYGGFSAEGTYRLTYYARDIWNGVSAPKQSYVTQSGYRERAVLVAGGESSDPGSGAVSNLASLAYHTFRGRRLAGNDICFLSTFTNQDLDADGANDVNGLPTLENLSWAITQWASTTNWGGPADKLTVYLIGNGSNGLLRLNATQDLAGAALDGWLDAYQISNRQALVAMEFAGAGAFLPDLRPSLDQERICIAAARTNQAVWWGAGTAGFSQYFLSGVFLGLDVGTAYTQARTAIRRVTGRLRQQAQLDDNGDGISDKRDGSLARQWHIGPAFVVGAEKPMIGTVMPDCIGDGSTGVTLWVSGITATEGISNVVCLVTAPDYDGTQPLPQVTLSWSDINDRYEASYVGLGAGGTYVCTFQAIDQLGDVSSPVQALVATPDAYEPDNTPGSARNFITETTQLHNFDSPADTDWVRFYVPSGSVYEIAAEQLFGNVDLRLDVWRQYPDGSWTNLAWLMADDEGTGTVREVTGVDLRTNPDLPAGFYYVQVSLATNTWWGPGSDYELHIFNTAAGEGLIIVAADVLDSSAPPPGAMAVVNGVATQTFGTATSVMTNLPAGSYSVQVPPVAGYQPLWDLTAPGQVTNPASYWFGNPKTIATAPMQYNVAIFQFMPMLRATGTVRDGLTSNAVSGARLTFTARSGVLSNVVFDGFPGQASYRTLWTTAPDGSFPTNVWLPTLDWDLTVTRPGYADQVVTGAIRNAMRDAETNAGIFALSPNLTTNGVPEWWLMKFGWSNDFVSAATNDTDGDGQPAWREWVSDTDPTNPASVLRVLSIVPGANGTRIGWQSGTSVWQYLERSGSLNGAPWTAAFTNRPPTLPATNVLDPAGTNSTLFYRIKTERY